MRERVAGKREGRGGRTTQGPSNRNLYYYLCTVHICTIYRKQYMCVEEIYIVKVHGLNKKCVDDFEELIFESVRDILELSYSEVTSLNSHGEVFSVKLTQVTQVPSK